MSSLTVERVAELVDEMAPAQAADILSALPDSDTNAILDKVDPTEAVKIRSLIERHDERILDMSTTHYIRSRYRSRRVGAIAFSAWLDEAAILSIDANREMLEARFKALTGLASPIEHLAAHGRDDGAQLFLTAKAKRLEVLDEVFDRLSILRRLDDRL